MPLSDWPRTSAAQLAQPAFNLSEDQFIGAIDGGFKAVANDPLSPAYWASTVDIPTLEGFGVDFELVCAALQAGRSSIDPEAMRSIKYNSAAGTVKFVQLNVIAIENVLGFSLEALRGFIDLAT